MPRFLANAIGNAGFSFFRWWLLNHSDRGLAARFRFLRRVIYAFTGDEFLRNVLGELAEIFAQGGKNAAMIRKMFGEPDRDFAVAIVKAALRRD